MQELHMGVSKGKFELTRTEKERQVKSKVKNMLIIFFDNKGNVHNEFFLVGQTVYSA
jgi:hypothetical protein